MVDLIGAGICFMGIGVLFWGFAQMVRASNEGKSREEEKKE